MEALNPQVVEEYFKLLETTLDENCLKNYPWQIHNCDETFLSLDYSRKKAVTLRGTENVYCQAQGTTDHITSLCCASAIGFLFRLWYFTRRLSQVACTALKALMMQYMRKVSPDGLTPSYSLYGWIRSSLSATTCYFIHCGHNSHVTLEVVDLCREHNIILFCLPLMPSKPLMFVSTDFSQVLRSPFECAFSIPNIKPGFGSISEVVEKAKMIHSTLHSSSWTSPPPISLLNTQVILSPLRSHQLPVPVLRLPAVLCSQSTVVLTSTPLAWPFGLWISSFYPKFFQNIFTKCQFPCICWVCPTWVSWYLFVPSEDAAYQRNGLQGLRPWQ